MSRFERVSVRRPLSVGLAVAATGIGLVALGRRREERAADRAVCRLVAAGRRDLSRAGTGDDHADLPEPVRRYLDAVRPEGTPPTERVRIDQAGELRLGDADSPWKPFSATHHATVGRPGFVWDARVELRPFVSVRIRDAVVDGEGSARVALCSAFPVAGAGSSPELNEAALQRYLAEAVWYPTALLPSAGVRWEPIDDRTARATLTHRGTTASLTFHFSERNRVERVHAERRYRSVDGGFEPTPWTGLWRGYERRGRVAIPTEGEVVWHLPDGDLHAWRGRVVGVERWERGETDR
jgi:hypothetical protein